MRHRRDDDRPRCVCPSTALGHPLFVIALAILVVNDHLLKGAGVLPTLVTGKLSDFAGLLVAPVVLAWIVRARTERRWLFAHAAVALGFTALQIVPPIAASIAELSASAIRLWPDPTDLVALPAIGVSYTVFRRAARAQRGTALVGALALLACTATSASIPAPPTRFPFRTGGLIRADLFLRHAHSEEASVELQSLREGVEAGCDAILEAPERALVSGDFGEPRSWMLARGDAVPVYYRDEDTPDRGCYAVRMTMAGRTWLLAWRHGAPPVRDDVPIRLGPDEPPEPDAVLVLEGEPLPRVPAGVTVRRL